METLSSTLDTLNEIKSQILPISEKILFSASANYDDCLKYESLCMDYKSVFRKITNETLTNEFGDWRQNETVCRQLNEIKSFIKFC